jgi:hypothetical protein
LPDPDAVQEIKIETVTSNAQFATPATAVLTTKSGTNRFHGSLFETARNNAIGNAVPRGTVRTAYLLPHLVRNEFGASVGGPILIPHVYDGKDKSFFFFSYERFSLGQSTPEAAFVPTAAMRGGDFSGLKPGGVLQQLYDPSTTGNAASNYQRQQFAGLLNGVPTNNVIPLSRISPPRESPLRSQSASDDCGQSIYCEFDIEHVEHHNTRPHANGDTKYHLSAGPYGEREESRVPAVYRHQSVYVRPPELSLQHPSHLGNQPSACSD